MLIGSLGWSSKPAAALDVTGRSALNLMFWAKNITVDGTLTWQLAGWPVSGTDRGGPVSSDSSPDTLQPWGRILAAGTVAFKHGTGTINKHPLLNTGSDVWYPGTNIALSIDFKTCSTLDCVGSPATDEGQPAVLRVVDLRGCGAVWLNDSTHPEAGSTVLVGAQMED